MKIPFNLKNIGAKAGQNVGMALWAGLIVLILLEGLVVRQAVNILLAANHVEPTPATQLVRINFGLYDNIAKRIERQNSFTPTVVTSKNPFGTLETTPPPVKK